MVPLAATFILVVHASMAMITAGHKVPHSGSRIATNCTKEYQGSSNPNIATSKECGLGMMSVSKVVGGTDADLGEYPWVAILGFPTMEGVPSWQCGASLIGPKHLLSAAHCFGSAVPYVARLGEFKLSTEEDCKDGLCAPQVQDILIDSYVVHEEFVPKNWKNDISIIKLTEPYLKTAFVRPICLPYGDSADESYDGATVTVTGFGYINSAFEVADVLQKLTTTIFPIDQCKKTYEDVTPIHLDLQLCAGGEDGKDSCNGDSGSGLITNFEKNGREAYELIALVSNGPTVCGTEGWPGVYTKVSPYLSWIEANLN